MATHALSRAALLLLATQATAGSTTSKLPDGVISVPLTRILSQNFYGMEFSVGTPPQKAILKADTGSYTIGFINPENARCQEDGAGCDVYGTYDNLTSSTAVTAFPRREYPDYSDGLEEEGMGSLVNDTVELGGVCLEDYTVGTIDEFGFPMDVQSPVTGIAGLSFLCESGTKCDDYPTIVQQLFDKGILKKRAFSIYLGPDDPDTVGTLLLGGIDRAKRGGPVITLPLEVYNDVPLNVPYTSLSILSSGEGSKNKTLIAPKGTAASWDTGNFPWEIPEALFDVIAPALGINASAFVPGSNSTVDCKLRSLEEPQIQVGFPHGHTISIPAGRLVSKAEDGGGCYTWLQLYGGGIVKDPSGVGTPFGAPFLRSVYFTFNVDDMTVSFSQVKYTDEEDIVAI